MLFLEMYLSNISNHAVNSLEALSFHMLSTEIKMEIEELFSSGLTPSQACNAFLRNSQNNSEYGLSFLPKKAERSKCPRMRDFNSLYVKYCH